jgi:hypothetical protein
VACTTYFVTRNSEQTSFEQEYIGAALKLAQGFQCGIDHKVWAASTFSAMYTSRYGGDTGRWPNATMPNFQEQAEGQLLLADGRALSFNPIITNASRGGWEAFATESTVLLGTGSAIHRRTNQSRIVADGIYRKDSNGQLVEDPGWSPESTYPDVLVPVWQIAPAATNAGAIMFNLHSETNRQRALDDMMTYNVPVLTAVLQLVQDSVQRPSSILFYPVRVSFPSEGGVDNVVASISIVFSWDDVLSRVLSSEVVTGLVCVLTI